MLLHTPELQGSGVETPSDYACCTKWGASQEKRAKHWSKVTFTVEDGRCVGNGGQIFFVIIRKGCIFVKCNCWKNAPKGVIGDVPKNRVDHVCCYCHYSKPFVKEWVNFNVLYREWDGFHRRTKGRKIIFTQKIKGEENSWNFPGGCGSMGNYIQP